MTGKHGPLSGITVVNLTQLLGGPLSTMILVDLGVEVIKIERPDHPKASGPFLNGKRIYDLSIQRSKKSITLNLEAEKNKRILMKPIHQADILVENFKPGTMKRMGFDYDVVSSVNPRITHMAISGFGYTGPYREQGALDMTTQGISGLMSLSGKPDGHPMCYGTSISDVAGGLYTFGAMAAALYDRGKTGNGWFIDIAMLDAIFSCLGNAVIDTCITGKNPTRVGNSYPTSVPFGTFPVLDGEAIITCPRDAAFYDFRRALNHENMIDDSRFSKAEARRRNRTQLAGEISGTTSQYTLDECEKMLGRFDVLSGRTDTMTTTCTNPQIAAQKTIVETEHPVTGRYRMVGDPIKSSQHPLTQYGSAPTLGQHTRQVFTEYLHMPRVEIDDLLAGRQPLCK